MGLRHLTAATLPDDPSKEVSSGEWNEDHKFTDANIGALLVRGASSDLVAGVSSVATGQVLISQGAGSVPAYSASPSLTNLTLASAGVLAWSTDVNLTRAGADVLAMQRSTNTQEFRLGPSASTLRVIKGDAGNAFIRTGDATSLYLGTNDTDRWVINTSGHFLATGAYNIGDESASDPVNLGLEGYLSLAEKAAPTGTANRARVYAEDNGSGKTRLMVIFGSGVAQQIAIEP